MAAIFTIFYNLVSESDSTAQQSSDNEQSMPTHSSNINLSSYPDLINISLSPLRPNFTQIIPVGAEDLNTQSSENSSLNLINLFDNKSTELNSTNPRFGTKQEPRIPSHLYGGDCGSIKNDNFLRIVGGAETQPHEYPWQVIYCWRGQDKATPISLVGDFLWEG